MTKTATLSPVSAIARIDDSTSAIGTRGIAGGWIAFGLALSLAVLVALMDHAELAIDPLAASTLPFYLCGSMALAARIILPRVTWRHARAVGDCAEYYALFTCIALMGAVASYPISALTHG